MATNMTVANTILEQLGGRRFMAMTGASNMTGSDKGLSFKIGRNDSKVTHVRVTLTPADLYDVEFLAIRGTSVRSVARDEGVYCDMLQATFTERTGMATHI